MALQSPTELPTSPTEWSADAVAPLFCRGRLLSQIVLLAMRAGMTIAKFLLAIYTARYLGLADLGIYGLLVAGTSIVPTIAGLGMTDWTIRKIVDLPSAQALPLMACRSGLTLSVHLIVQPLALGLDVLLGEPIPLRLAVLAGLILMLENLGTEASDMLIARRHVFLSNGLSFLRTGVWPILVIAIGLAYPQTRTLDALLLVWIAVLALNTAILLGLIVMGGRWRHMRLPGVLFLQQLHGSRALYLKDVSTTSGIFVDRFLISMFLGLELTGVYTFFWSIANVMHSLSVVGVLQSQLAPLLGAGRKADKAEFRALERRLQIETGSWAMLLALGLAVATPLLLPLLDRPLLRENIAIFWLILFATLLRVAADGYAYVLLALNRDSEIAMIALSGALASAAMNSVLTPLAGLWGAAMAYAVTAGGLFAIRFYLTRPRSYCDLPKK